MMVPQVARAVLSEVTSVHPEVEVVNDPFAGSGTILTESMLRGLSFSGTDINPLAVLLCKVKSGPFFVDALDVKIAELYNHIDTDNSAVVEVAFPNIDKWFRKDVSIALSRLRRAILKEDSCWARRFFWVAMAEAVRVTSNSRTSTFKLHIRTPEDIKIRSADPVAVFKRALQRNARCLRDQARSLSSNGLLKKGRYYKSVGTKLLDVRFLSAKDVFDIVMTSPPYGDNRTTVPYGQYSYLALQWIELSDIDQHASIEYLRSTHEIDTRSLGGKSQVTATDRQLLIERSASYRNYVKKLEQQPSDREKRVTSFFRDLNDCLKSILPSLRCGGIMIWTLGNRKVGGTRVPLDDVLIELLEYHQVKFICKLSRKISSKRMAFKNNIADTMSHESIVIMRKASISCH